MPTDDRHAAHLELTKRYYANAPPVNILESLEAKQKIGKIFGLRQTPVGLYSWVEKGVLHNWPPVPGK